MAALDRQNRVIHVHLLQHKTTDLLAAVSDDLYGLVVHGRTEDEIRERLPAAIRELLEAAGHTVHSLAVERDDRHHRAGFGLPAYVASAALASQHRDR